MASIFGDDGIDDLLNDNLRETDELPGDEDHLQNEQLFGEEGAGEGEGPSQDAVKVEPKKRSVRNPRPRLTVETLRGPRGIHTIEDYFKDIKYKGKGHEKEDLDEVLRRLQHWAHRMYPNYKFEDVLNNIERLGKKKPLQVHMSRYRLGMLENLKQGGGEGGLLDHDEAEAAEGAGLGDDEPFDEFDALLGEQIAISKLAPRTPAHNHNQTTASSSFNTPSFSRGKAVMSTPYTQKPNKVIDDSDLAQPLPPSQPEEPVEEVAPARRELTAEQLARIAENRRIALERLEAKKARLKQQQEQQQNEQNPIERV